MISHAGHGHTNPSQRHRTNAFGGSKPAETCRYCEGSFTASGRSKTVSTKLKIEVLAPMPSAMEMIASAAKPGCLISCRKPKRISCRSVSISAPSYALLDAAPGRLGFRKFATHEFSCLRESGSPLMICARD